MLIAAACAFTAACPLEEGDPDGDHPPDVEEPGPFPYVTCDAQVFPSDLRALIQDKLDAYPDVPGAVVSLYHPSVGSVIAAFGTTEAGGGEAMPVDAVFDIGSVHKLFKWVVLEKIHDEGLISYQDPISSFVQRPTISGATVTELTNHSTGMVDIGDNFYADVFAHWQSGAAPVEYTYDEMMNFLESDTRDGATGGFVDGFSVGADYNYSSYGPVVAAEIIEAVTGTSAYDFMRSRIFHDLNLPRTSLIGLDPKPSGIVLGHGADDGTSASAPKATPPDAILTGVSSGNRGAIFSRGCDTLNFARAISDPSIGYLTAQTIASRTDDAIDVGGFYDVARGVFRYHGFGTGDFWAHAGDGMSGHSSLVGYNPTAEVAVSVHANLRPLYIPNDFAAHFDILGVLSAYFAPSAADALD